MPTEEERKRIERGIKKELQDEILKRQRELKDQAKQVKDEASALKKEENSFQGKGERREKRWDIVRRKGADLTDRNVAGFNPMEINLMELVYAGMEIAKANWYDPINPIQVVTRYLPGMVELELGLKGLKKTVITDNVDSLVNRHFISDSELAKISFSAMVNDEGHFTSSISKDNKPAAELQLHLTAAVEGWAQTHGYTLGHDGEHQIFTHDATGDRMDKARFDELNNNPETGLEAYLTNRFGVQARAEPDPEPEPAAGPAGPAGPGL